MTLCTDDFIETSVATKNGIKGLGEAMALKQDTIQYSSQNNKGKVAHFTSKSCYYYVLGISVHSCHVL